MSLSTLLKSVNKGFLKDVLTGAGFTLGTSAITLTALNTAINSFKSSLIGVPVEILGLAHIAGFDYGFSIILGAIVAKNIQDASKLTIKSIK